MMNWKNTVAKINAKHYAFPAGWDTREEIAEQLECSTDRVDTLLAPGLKSGEIEKQQFPVWDERLNRKMMVMGYRQVPRGKAAKVQEPEDGDQDFIRLKVIEAHQRNPSLTPGRLRDYLPKKVAGAVNAAMIQEIIDSIE